MPNEGTPMTKGSEGVWELTLESVPPGAYRYNFNVDGVNVTDFTPLLFR